ncbi:Homeobox-like_domain superfamily [Hexamita inflata]|uniref:Homeobox-like domain superfamily n=1 Tax=Hexamita inflata TaxID=28002 RepID=A0AA86PMT0_9EUKA|nr:Homeobox-like domain superfamily [Hexamita inflata]
MYTNQRWTEAENNEFKLQLKVYPGDFMQVAKKMNKSYSQVRSHFYNIEKKARDLKLNLNLAKIEKDLDKSMQSQSEQPKYQLIVFDFIK